MYKRDRLDIIHSNMIQRCFNKNSTFYERYGGRGITVCDERRSRKNFKTWAKSNGYSDGLTIERIDNDGDYSPTNCKWATSKEQCNNRSSCHMVTAYGKRQSLMNWSIELGISYNTLKKRAIDHHEVGEHLLRPSRREVIKV